MAIVSQAAGTLAEGAETTGEVISPLNYQLERPLPNFWVKRQSMSVVNFGTHA